MENKSERERERAEDGDRRRWYNPPLIRDAVKHNNKVGKVSNSFKWNSLL